MAHAVETMAWAGETPWHGLGVKVPANLTPRKIQKAAGVDWRVQKVPLFASYNNKQLATGHSALVRDSDDVCLTVVTDDWEPLQNDDAFDFFTKFVKAGDMEMHTAGSLKKGKVVFALAKVRDGFSLFNGDDVESYLLLTNPHEYGKGIDVRFTPIRVVCANTLAMALNGKSDLQVSVTHRTKFDPEYVKKTLGLAHDKLENFKEAAEFLGSKRYNMDTVEEYFDGVFPSMKKDSDELSRAAKLAMEALDSQPGMEFAKGSWWQAFNAVTFLTDHKLGHNNDTRLHSAWYGQNRKRKLDALNSALEYAQAA